MYNFCTGMLVLMTAGYSGISAARGNWIMGVICILASVYLYLKLERNTLDK